MGVAMAARAACRVGFLFVLHVLEGIALEARNPKMTAQMAGVADGVRLLFVRNARAAEPQQMHAQTVQLVDCLPRLSTSKIGSGQKPHASGSVNVR